MDHVAIMKKSWGFTEKILSGEKVIESRWYSFKRCPWNQVKSGDTVYFKNSGELVKLKASVKKVLQLENLTPEKVSKILGKYGKLCGIPAVEIPTYFQKFKDKKYCILIYLACVKEVDPFEIDKTGFGAMASWLCVPKIDTLAIS